MDLVDKKLVVRESQQDFLNTTRKYLYEAENEKLFLIYKKNIDEIINCLKRPDLDYNEAIECKRSHEKKYFSAEQKLNDLMHTFDVETNDCLNSCKDNSYKEFYECSAWCMKSFSHF